jgi:hypothetical protein
VLLLGKIEVTDVTLRSIARQSATENRSQFGSAVPRTVEGERDWQQTGHDECKVERHWVITRLVERVEARQLHDSRRHLEAHDTVRIHCGGGGGTDGETPLLLLGGGGRDGVR